MASSTSAFDFEEGNVERPALGRVCNLGSLYDVSSESLLPGMIFEHQLPDSVWKTTPCASTYFKFDHENTQSSALDNWDVGAELKLNILYGNIKLGGQAKYSDTVNTNEEVDRLTLVYTQKTQRDQLHISHRELHCLLCRRGFEFRSATHAVTEIIYGGHVACTFDQNKSDRKEKNEKSAHGEASASKLMKYFTDLSADGAIKHLKEEESKGQVIHIRFHGDLNIGEIPTNVDEALTIIKSIPSRIGKGIQVAFVLTPLSDIYHYVKASMPGVVLNEKVLVCTSDNGLLKRIQTTLDEMRSCTERVKTFVENVNKYAASYKISNWVLIVKDFQVNIFYI
jgi:hypothetical protein